MKILIPVNIYQKLRGYAQATKFEISGLGKVSFDGKNILVEDIKIFDQEVSSASTKLNQRSLARFYDELLQAGEELAPWKMWWHSHARMETFWSATDIATIEDFDTEMNVDNWVLALETNHEDEIIARIDIFRPLRVTVPEAPWEIHFEDKRIEDAAFSEAMLNIKFPKEKKANGRNPLSVFQNKDKNTLHISGIEHDQLFPDSTKTITVMRGGKIVNENKQEEAWDD